MVEFAGKGRKERTGGGRSMMHSKLASLLAAALAIANAHCAPLPDTSVAYTVTPVAGAMDPASLYPEFAAVATASFVVPGLEEGLVPQGLAWLPQRNWFLVSGYHSDKSPSALVAVDPASGEIARQASLKNPDGSAYTGHAGGVAATAGSIIVSGEGKLHCLPLPAFLDGTNGAVCSFTREITVPNRASYCFCGDDVFWVGEFRHPTKPEYSTDRSHCMEVDGEKFQAWLCGYELRDGELPLTEQGYLQPPDYILETPDKVQGVSVSDGIVWLSCSFGRGNDSRLLAFGVPFRDASTSNGNFEVSGTNVPVWFLGRERQIEIASMKAPPMSENLCCVGDDVYVLFESGAKEKRGKSGKERPVDRCFRFPNRMPAMEMPAGQPQTILDQNGTEPGGAR